MRALSSVGLGASRFLFQPVNATAAGIYRILWAGGIWSISTPRLASPYVFWPSPFGTAELYEKLYATPIYWGPSAWDW
jgi:hypothetical protein